MNTQHQSATTEVIPAGYKQTEVGVIPEDWEVMKFSDATQLITCGIAATPTYVPENIGFPFLSSTNVKRGKVIWENYKFISAKLHGQLFKNNPPLRGDILYSRVGAIIGEAAVIEEDFEFSIYVSLTLIKLKRNVLNCYYLSQLLNSEPYKAKAYEQVYLGAGVGNLNVEVIREYQIPIPPKQEQTAIANALSDVDALIQELEKLIAKKRDIKEATMQQLLTGRTRLVGFEGEWEVKRLGDVALLNRVNILPAAQPKQQFVHFSLPAFDEGKIPKIELGSEIGSNKFWLPPNAILVSKLNPRIRRVWAPEIISQHTCASTEWLVLTPREGTNREFLFVLCSSSSFCQKMEISATGTTGSHQRISPSTALDIPVSIPVKEDEQTAIANILTDMDTEIQTLEQRLAKTRQLKQGMMQELLTGRTRLVQPNTVN
jgi:type I restriction enzyme S subunit